MPKKWEAEDELKLLLGVIHIISAQVPGSAWPDVATYMGEGYTAESVRQKFQNIKRTTEGPPSTAKGETPTKSTPTSAAKSTKAKAPTTKGSATKVGTNKAKGDTPTKNRKRKAAAASSAENDDEESMFGPKAKAAKIKNEEATDSEAGIGDEVDAAGAEVFKVEPNEDEEGVIDGERDDLYA